MTVYFTSDHHFYHSNILEFEDRPYKSMEEMHQGLIEAWNSVVKNGDKVYHLGDFCFGGYDKWVKILEQLNGDIYLIKGNHCRTKIIRKLYKEGYLKELHMVGEYMKINGYQLNLTHYPLAIGYRRKMYSIHGHLHNGVGAEVNMINIGVDSPLNFNRPFGQPIHIDELMNYIEYINPQVEEKFFAERGI